MKFTHLLASDFDGTIVDTGTLSPNNVTVDSAYEHAIDEIFGARGVVILDSIGGVASREPGELISLILETGARNDVELMNGYRNPAELTEELIRIKLEELVPEISVEWPRVFPGFHDYYAGLQDNGISLAVISNGHDGFIGQVFEVNDLPQPDILITSDTLRRNGEPKRFKPDPYSLELCVEQFRELNGNMPQSMLLVGDSRAKDGGLARNFGIPFGFFDPMAASDLVVDSDKQEIIFKEYATMGRLIEGRRKTFIEGGGFNQLFLNGMGHEGRRPMKERK